MHIVGCEISSRALEAQGGPNKVCQMVTVCLPLSPAAKAVSADDHYAVCRKCTYVHSMSRLVVAVLQITASLTSKAVAWW